MSDPDLTARDLSTVLAEGRRLADEATGAFGQLSPEQVNWKPSEGEWSIGQCFDHLIRSNQAFVPIIEAILGGGRRQSAWERIPLLPSFFGRLLIRALRPDSGWKTTARPAFSPSRSQIAADIVARFLAQQGRLLGLMVATRGLDLDAITITSPVSRVITYSLMDAYRIILVHEQNHVAQATRVREWPGFPAH
jgi:hypothetical protein